MPGPRVLNYRILGSCCIAPQSATIKDWAHDAKTLYFPLAVRFPRTCPAAESAAEPPAEAAIAAAVGDDPVGVAEVQRLMDDVFPDKKPAGDLLPAAQAQVLEEIVNRRLVLAYARRVGEAPGAAELDKAKKELQIRLAAQGRKVSDVLKAESITAADLDRQVLWRLVWDRFLARYRTPQRREAWFQKHHAELDGTELVVSHILLRPAAGAGLEEIEGLEKQAATIREEIVAGKVDFPAAARKYSAGPSGKQGGRLGKIGRHGPMDEAFSLRRLQAQGRRDQSAGSFVLWRPFDPLRRGRARNEEARQSQRAHRRGLGERTAGKNIAARTTADRGEIHVRLAAFQAGDAGTGEVTWPET